MVLPVVPRLRLIAALVALVIAALAAGPASAATGSGTLYWTTDATAPGGHDAAGAIGSTPTDDPAGSAVLARSGGTRPGSIVVGDDGFLYWIARSGEDDATARAARDDDHRATVYRSDLDGRNRVAIRTGACSDPIAIAVADGWLYVLDGQAHEIGRVPLGAALGDRHCSCGPIDVPSGSSGVWADADHVYWTNPGKGIGRATTSGGNPVQVFIAAADTGASQLTGVAGRLLWTANGGAQILTASTAGGAATALSTGDGGVATDVAGDGSAIYWTRGDGKAIGSMSADGSNPQPLRYPSVTGSGRQGMTSLAIAPSPRRTLTVQMEGSRAASGLVASVGDAGIACPTMCSASFATGTRVHLVASGLLGSGTAPTALAVAPAGAGSCSVAEGTCDIDVDVDVTLIATFDGADPGGPLPLDVTFAGSGAGVVTGGTSFATTPFRCLSSSAVPCDPSLPANARVTLIANQYLGARFVGWSGACSGASPTCVLTMTGPLAVTAQFAMLPAPLPPAGTSTVDVTVSEGGAVHSVPAGIECPGDCSAAFPDDELVTLIAEPAAGYAFSSWAGAGCARAQTRCVFTPVDDTTVDAIFVPDAGPAPAPAPAPVPTPTPTPAPSTPTVPLELIKDGTPLGWVYSDPAAIACNLNCTVGFPVGTDVVLHAREAPNADFLGWGGTCVGAELTCRITMRGPRRAVARFNQTGQLTLTRLQVSTRAVIVGRQQSAARAQHAVRGGAVISYRVSENAAVTLTFTRVWPRAKRQPVLRLRFRDGLPGGRPGLNTVRFTGRIGATAMTRGVWRMTASADDGTSIVRATLPSKPVYFRVARPGERLPLWR